MRIFSSSASSSKYNGNASVIISRRRSPAKQHFLLVSFGDQLGSRALDVHCPVGNVRQGDTISPGRDFAPVLRVLTTGPTPPQPVPPLTQAHEARYQRAFTPPA
jgi:hypothetical protein